MKQVEKWSLIYEILRPIGKIIHRMSYRKIIITGLDNIPKNTPVILAPNHQNALSDALAVLLYTRFQPVFLGRADMFKNKVAEFLLHFLKISPVFRIRDGKETLDKNRVVFDNCVRILTSNKIICIYPEAAHIAKKSMLPHKKAIPRIALLAAQATNFEIDVKVIPVAIYYSHYYNFRRELFVHYGKPLSSKDYYEIYHKQGEARATAEFRNDLFQAETEIMVNVNDKASYDLYDLGFELMRPKAFKKLGIENHLRNKVEAEKFLNNKIQIYLEANPDEKDKMLQKAQLYKRIQNELDLSEKVIDRGPIGFASVLINFFAAILTIPFAMPGIVSNGWLFYLTRYSYRKKIKDLHFYSTISFGLSFLIFPFWFLAQFFIFYSIFDSSLIALGILILSLPSGILAWEVGQLLLRTIKRIKLANLMKSKNKQFLQLQELRSDLIAFYNQTID